VREDGAVTAYAYNADGQVTARTEYLNLANTANWFDGTQVTHPTVTIGAAGSGADVITAPGQDRVTQYGYDAAGRRVTETDAAGGITTTIYDGESRVVEQDAFGGRVVRTIYDHDGLLRGTVDARGTLTEYTYNAAGDRLKAVSYATASVAGG